MTFFYPVSLMSNKILFPLVFSVIFLFFGFWLIHSEVADLGLAFFIFLPIILGFTFGERTLKSVAFLGLIMGLAIFLLLLLYWELEGVVCILMASPLILLGVGIGISIKYVYLKLNNKEKGDNTIKSSIIPFVLLTIVSLGEKTILSKTLEIETVTTSISLPYSSMEVYDGIKSVNKLDGPKPFLMKLDLPIPLKCVLEEEKVGALRTCYFEKGKIIERVTELSKGKILRMDVIDYQLTGRSWLNFDEAIYTFEAIDEKHCKMSRITTYTSALYPRLYWSPLEKIGVSQEHDYVINNLIKDLKSSSKKNL